MKILTDNQQSLLKAVGGDRSMAQQFYLTGGTPLAVFYLSHRYSEDLDFFSEKEIDVMNINVFFQRHKKSLGIKTVDSQQNYNRNLFFVCFADKSVVKTEFTYFPFPRIELGPVKNGVRVDSILDIAVNKLFTIYQRTQARDYIDLYFICKQKGYAINDLVKKAKKKFDWHIDPIQLGTQFIKAADVLDMPRMIVDLSATEWRDFFFEEAKKLKDDILLP